METKPDNPKPTVSYYGKKVYSLNPFYLIDLSLAYKLLDNKNTPNYGDEVYNAQNKQCQYSKIDNLLKS